MAVEHPIGKVIDLPDGRKVEVVKDNKPSILLNCACWVCAFGKEGNRKYCGTISGECSGVTRTDRIDIIYKEIITKKSRRTDMKLTYEQRFWRALEHWALPKLNNLIEWIDIKRQIADLKSDRIKNKKED